MIQKFWTDFENNISGNKIPNLFELIKNYFDDDNNSDKRYFSWNDSLEDNQYFTLLKDVFIPVIKLIENKVSWFTVFFYDEIHEKHDFVIYFPDNNFKNTSFKNLYNFANEKKYYTELDNSSSLLFKENIEKEEIEKKILCYSFKNSNVSILPQTFNELSYEPVQILKINIKNQKINTIDELISKSDEYFNEHLSEINYLEEVAFYQQFDSNGNKLKKIFRYFYWLTLLRKQINFNYYYYFPATLLSRRSVGGIVIATKSKFSKENLILCQYSSNRVFSLLSNQALGIYSNQVVNYATKSATAAIMARNMSHNLGSHILFYLKSILNHTPKRLENLLYELEKADKGGETIKILKKYENKVAFVDESEIQAPFLRGLGKFIGYLQERQDFIATIASDFIPYFDSVNFKDFIYDELLPDKKQKRHGSYEIKNIFLDFIAKSEGYDSDSIDVLINGFNGNNTDDDKLKELRKLKVDLPGGILGRQAFFSIFENILRNSAKHNEFKGENLQLWIDIEEDKEFPDFYKISIYDNQTNFNEVYEIIGNALKEPYINSSGKMLKTNKGIKEIRISAAWLRGLSVAEINEGDIGIENEPEKILQIEEKENRLAYVFYLYKSKTAAFITKKCEDEISQTIDCFTLDQYKKIKNKNYKILLVDKTLDENTKEEIKKISVPRVLEVSNEEVVNKINEEVEDKNQNTAEFFHIKFIKDNFKDIIDFDKDKFITIVDTIKSADNNNISKHIKFLDGETYLPINPTNSTIFFRTHNDTKEKFLDFKKKFSDFYKKCLFIEGISGDNSTARLLRNEKKTDYWAFKMAESALTKIIVFDERLFDIFGGFITGEKFSANDFQDCNSQTVFTDKIIEMKGKTTKTVELYIGDYFSLSNNPVAKEHKLKDVINALNNPDTYTKTENYKFDILQKKNIELFNIIKTNKSLDIYNLKGGIVFNDFSNQLKDFKEGEKKSNARNTDFLLIHQTLLDNLFNYVNNKLNKKRNKNDKEIKREITKFLKSYFNVKQRIIIHSGRSEPEFLPEEAVFNQFSSIDNAFSDCKFTLSELLYSGRKN